MKTLKWLIGAVILTTLFSIIIIKPIPFLFYQDLPYLGFLGRVLYIIILACFLVIYRIWRGPTGADRIVAVDILGIMIVGLCAVLTISTHRSWYIDIGIAWALQSFISTLALSKYLEGRDFDE
ncbi:MAG: cation:proton antiporter [Candidatus Omnitrophica bacterium]|nr:cation:proton antiporter [Candidatus Omnitrophota bacterium]